MERTTKKYAVTGMYGAIVLVEFLVIVASIASFVTAEFSYMFLACANLGGAVVLDEMLKALCRSDDDWYEAYVDTFQHPPLPGSVYRVACAVIKRRRLQRGWLRL